MSALVLAEGSAPLSLVDDEMRIEDVVLAEWLEYEDVDGLRKLIARNADFLKRQGILPRRVGEIRGRGQPRKSYWLNKKQALFIASKSDKPKGSEILLMLVEVFDAAQEDARRQAIEEAAAKSYIYTKIFLELPVHTESLWTVPILQPIAALYGVNYTGGRAPVETRRVQREIYDLIVGSDLVRELREKHPDPPGENGTPYIYDHFHPSVRKAVEVELGKVATLAETSTSRDDFRAKLRAKYGTSMLQLVFGGKETARWSLPPAHKGEV